MSDAPPLMVSPPADADVIAATCGGKAAGLCRLTAAGANVPPCVVATTAVLDVLLADEERAATVNRELATLAGLDPATHDGRRAIDEAGARIRNVIEAAPLPTEVRELIAAAVKSLGNGPFAVRSSMVGEDSASHSFAGQLDSFLFQQSADDVIDSVRRCFASAFSARSLAYRLRSGLAMDRPRMGVVVQRMIDGSPSGVMFTAHPISGHRDRCLITACPGLGEGVVSGACDTDEFVHDANGEVSVKVVPKATQIVRVPDGRGTVEADVPVDQQEVRCLSPAIAAAIAAEGRRIAEAFDSPQDIEWTLEGDTLWLLQSRPITSLPPAPPNDATTDAAGPRVVWDNSNIQESYCGVTTPLTFSFARAAYASVYAQTMRALGLSQRTVDDHGPMLRNMLGLIRGRVYYNINNWYRALLLLPSFGRNKADMEQMMGLTEPVDFVKDQVLGTWQKLRLLPGMLMTIARLLASFARMTRLVERFMRDFESRMRRVDRAALPGMTLSQLMEAVQFLQDEVVGDWHVPILNDLYVMMATGAVRRQLTRRFSADDAARLQNALLSGEDGIESVEPTRMLMRMAKDAAADDKLTTTLRNGSPEDALAAARKLSPAFDAQVAEYIERYGDRVMGELKLETRSLREQPGFIAQVLRNFLSGNSLPDPDDLLRRERERRNAADAELRSRLSAWQRWRLRRACARARTSIKARERMRLARTRLFGLFRDVYRAIGDRLHTAGRLDDARQIFWLTTDEISEYHEGRAVTTDLAALARLRQAEFAAFEQQAVPDRLETRGAVYHGNELGPTTAEFSSANANARMLRGTGCSPGLVTAQLAVVLSPDDDLAIDGRILTTVRTDPGWAPLFPSAAAVLIERGSTLSHSAVLARELGIPAVVGVPGLLQIVRHGERVTLDGASGLVERLEVDA